MIFKEKDKKFKFKWPRTSAGKEVYLKYKNFKPHQTGLAAMLRKALQAGHFWSKFFSLECLLPILIILEIAVFSIVFAVIFRYPKSAETPVPAAFQPTKTGSRTCLEDATSTLYAVMIDNMLEGRPSVGLGRADLVYEAPAEAGITRFLAVYCVRSQTSTEVLKSDFNIGPIRSLRPYFLDWAEELGAPVAHVGGSPEAMSLVKKSSIPDLDQYYNGTYFWRSSDRLAPHNVFTTLAKLDEFLKAKFPKFEPKERDVWEYKIDCADAQGAADDADDPLPTLPLSKRGRDGVGDFSAQSVSEISIDYILPEHLVRWVYDLASNSYFRFQNGAEHADGDGSKISAKNVVIQITNIEVIDEIGRRKIRTTGEGKAMIFADGKMIRGTWKRPPKDSLTRFYDLAGEEIQFNRGNIWIEVVADYHKVSIQN